MKNVRFISGILSFVIMFMFLLSGCIDSPVSDYDKLQAERILKDYDMKKTFILDQYKIYCHVGEQVFVRSRTEISISKEFEMIKDEWNGKFEKAFSSLESADSLRKTVDYYLGKRKSSIIVTRLSVAIEKMAMEAYGSIVHFQSQIDSFVKKYEIDLQKASSGVKTGS